MASTASLEPTTLKERISLIDALRGMALLGILMMNMPFFSNPYQVHFDLEIQKEYSGPNYWCWWIVNGLFEGTMRGTFSILFGAGSLLLLERLQARHEGLYPADIYYRRLLLLIMFGLFNAFILNWAGDILFAYGVCGLFLFPLRKLKPASLAMIGVGCLVVATLFATLRTHGMAERKEKGLAALALEKKGLKLTDDQKEEKASWEKYLENRKPEKIREKMNKEVEAMHKGYFGVMEHQAEWNVKFESIELYKDLFWDATGFFLIGMALFKWNVLTGRRSKRFYWIMAIVCLGIGIPFQAYMLRETIAMHFDWAAICERWPIPPYQLRRLLMTLGNIGLFISLYKLGWFNIVFRWLARVGQMAFSNYLGQSIICSIIFYGYGLGYFGQLQRYQTYEVVAAIWLFQIIFSTIWLHYYRFGPFEWVWRSLTYGKAQPMVKRKAEEAFVG